MNTSAQITQIRLPSGKVIALVDWSDLPIFSTVDLCDGFSDQTIQAFNYVVSDQVSSSQNVTVRRTATERDTNATAPGRLAATEEMLVYNIKVEPFAFVLTTPTDATTLSEAGLGLPHITVPILDTLHFHLLLQLEVTQKLFANAGFGYYNQGFGVVPTVGNEDGYAAANQGAASAEAPRSFTIPVHIGGQENYAVLLQNPTGEVVRFRAFDATGTAPTLGSRLVMARIYLEGLYKRPVS